MVPIIANEASTPYVMKPAATFCHKTRSVKRDFGQVSQRIIVISFTISMLSLAVREHVRKNSLDS